MKMINNNKKLIIGFLFGIILASTLSVCAYSYLAENIGYTKDGTEITNVKQALNDLYSKTNKERYYLYNQDVDRIQNEIQGGHDGFSGTFATESYGGKNCKYFSFSEDRSDWSSGVRYQTNEINIQGYKKLVIDYAKLNASGDYVSQYVAFLNNSGNVIDVVPISDTSINAENKEIEIDLDLINQDIKYIVIGAQTGVNKGNIYKCFVNNVNDYHNEYNGSASAYIREIYLEK